MVALLCLGRAWVRAAIALVARLFAVVAESLGRGADLGIVADVATLETSSPRHCSKYSKSSLGAALDEQKLHCL
jgi:hypothetical protein